MINSFKIFLGLNIVHDNNFSMACKSILTYNKIKLRKYDNNFI